jgi:hypothetical protein
LICVERGGVALPQGGRLGMVYEEATPTTPKPAEPHGTQEMRRT